MIVDILGSNSKGNCYIFTASSGESLIVDVGVSARQIKKALNFDLSGVVGALVTHEHGDHAKGVKEIVKAGIDVYASQGTCSKLVQSHRVKIISRQQQIGDFNIYTFAVLHDAAEPTGFIINHHDCGNVLYLTDSNYVPYKFKNIRHYFIEANYCNSVLKQKQAEGAVISFVASRVRRSHLSIDDTARILLEADLAGCKSIVLTHLSDTNSNEQQFINTINSITGISTSVARNGLKINLDVT